MKAADVRRKFLEFFAEHGHERVASAALVPANDPTLLFTNAGMVQFKDLFTGQETRDYRRATSSQKCVRAGGKHNDLDEVGKTPRHHTFFEMLGNFSFGDYFKADAIKWAWELLTEVYGIDKDRLIITVFSGDEEMGVGGDDDARAIWREVTGFSDERIIGLGKQENFWMMGEVGPMGPCSEIHYFAGDAAPTVLPTAEDPDSAWEPWLEIWNLVFMQYERKVAGGPLDKLPAPSIDTGAGLERLAAVLQGVASNYDTDMFAPIIATAARVSGKTYGASDEHDTSMRVIADHARTTCFLIADGVFPENTGREYVLRRIFRRAVRHGKMLGIEQLFMHEVCATVIAEMSDVYPELAQHADIIDRLAREEEAQFRRTMDRGLGMLEDEFARLRRGQDRLLAGDKVFQLYDTYGFPADLTDIIAAENGFTVDHAGFERELERARERSRFRGGGAEAITDIHKALASEFDDTHFVGYDGRGVEGHGTILAIIREGERVTTANTGESVELVFDETPCYAESGGQVGDAGCATTAKGGAIQIDDCRKPAGGVHLHLAQITEGTVAVGDAVEITVDDERRERIRANHSATHLMNLALSRVLGSHVAQKGSLVTPDKLRFDFAHFSPMTAEQKRAVEDWVNHEIRANHQSRTEVLPIADAKKRGAVAVFGEKYGETVRVVHIGGESLEFCGGTHVRRAGDIGLFKITSESGVAQGVRRVEAVTGASALDYVRRLEDQLGLAGAQLKVSPFEVAERLDKLQADQRKQAREIAALKRKLAAGGSRDLMSEVVELCGVKLLAASTEVEDVKTLRETGDNLKSRLGSGIVLLAGIGEDKVSLVAMITKDLTDRFHAGKLLAAAAEVLGGRGGGRPDMAQGGGRDIGKVDEALATARTYVSQVSKLAKT